MQVKIAAYHNKSGGTTYLAQDEDGTSWADKNADYVRATATVDIDLPDLPHEAIVIARLKTLDAEEEKLKDNFHRALKQVQEQRENLLALPAA